MKIVIALALVAAVAARPGEYYDSKFDNINIDEIVENPILLKNYVNCFIDTGKCTPEAKEYKNLIPEGVRTSCAKCSESQKPIVAKFIHAIQHKLPEQWTILNKKNDPDGKYQEELNNFIKQYQH